MGSGVVFGKIIGAIEDALFPVYNKLSLSNAVADPIETHINGFGTFLFDNVIGNSVGSTVVGLDRCGWLGIPQFFEGDANRAGFFAIVEECSKFRFRGTGDNFAHYSA